MTTSKPNPRILSWDALVGAALLVGIMSHSIVAHVRNDRTLRDADEQVAKFSIHHRMPTDAGRTHEGLRHQRVFKELYPQDVIEHLLTLPRLQVEAGLVWQWLLPVSAFGLAARARKRGLRGVAYLRSTIFDLAIGGLLASAVLAGVQAIALREEVGLVLTALARFVLSYAVVGAGYLAWFSAIQARFGRTWTTWLGSSLLGLWGAFALRMAMTELYPRASFWFLATAERYLLAPKIGDIAVGLLIGLTWLVAAILTAGRFISAQHKDPLVANFMIFGSNTSGSENDDCR